MKLIGTLITILVVALTAGLGMLFALQNEVPVPLDVLIYRFEPRSLALWVLSAFAVGGLFGLLFSSVITLRQRAALSRSRRQLARTESELERLRAAGSSGGE